jgi:hypothetical protein
MDDKKPGGGMPAGREDMRGKMGAMEAEEDLEPKRRKRKKTRGTDYEAGLPKNHGNVAGGRFNDY